MNTETTVIKTKPNQRRRTWAFYDGDCPLCVQLAGWSRRPLARRGVAMAPLRTPWVAERLGIRATDPLRELVVLEPGDVRFGGVDAIARLMRRIWWAWPFWLVANVPLCRGVLGGLYRWIAARRHCLTGGCSVHFQTAPQTNRLPVWDWLPLVILTALAFGGYSALPQWAFMWTIAFALYAGCKWATWSQARRNLDNPGIPRSLGYLLFWIGMDPQPFFQRRKVAPAPIVREWAAATLKLGIGIGLVWGLTPAVIADHQTIGIWIGMTGVIMTLHFGLFHLVSLAWRRIGVAAVPIMRAPLKAASLGEFWGKRWNKAFNDIVRPALFRPLLRRRGPVAATLCVFLLSGLVHDLVISVPARAGYGLPTLYFLIQGIGVLLIRSAPARRAGLNRGMPGWLTTLAVTAIPAPLLFHAPFRDTVMFPFLQTLNAI